MVLCSNSVGGFIPIILAAFSLAAQQEPAWTVNTTINPLFMDEDEIADGTEFVYTVSNTSPGGDANNLISFTIGAGSNQDVFNVRSPLGCRVEVCADKTVFGNVCVSPQNSADFYFWTTFQGTAQATASAESLDIEDCDFPVLTVPVPAHARPTITLARADERDPGHNVYIVSVTSPDAPSFLLQYKDSLAATNWTDLARVAATGAVTVATDTNAAPARFYRAVVPVP